MNKIITFEDWFHQLEEFSLKSERFFDDCEYYSNCTDAVDKMEAEAIILAWLKAAFEAGRESG
jgi:hypothetical protein